MLLDATAAVDVRLGVSVTGLEDGGAPRVTFSDGSTGTYDLVVGADGVHSTVRSLALGGPAPGFVGQASWRFVVDGVPDIRDWTVMLDRGRIVPHRLVGQWSRVPLRRRQHERFRWRRTRGLARVVRGLR